MNVSSRRFMILFLLALSGIISASSAQAVVNLTPESLTITGYRGSSQTRYILIQSGAEEDISQIEPITLDLNRTDGQAILTADAVTVEIPDPPLPQKEAIKIPLTVDLTRATGNGQFQGTVLLNYESGQQRLPININVKARPWWPLVTIIAGVLVGTTLSDYRAKGFNRDEITLDLGRLRTQIRSDRTFPKPFENRIQAYLIDIETSLANLDWSAARNQLSEAQTLWNNWRKGRHAWLAELDYYSTLQTAIDDELGTDTFYCKAVESKLKDIYRQIPDYQEPYQLEDQLELVRQQIDRFQQGEARIIALSNAIEKMTDANQKKLWELKPQSLQQQLYNLKPASEEDFKAWYQEVETQTEKLFQELQSQNQVGDITAVAARAAAGQAQEDAVTLAPPPATSALAQAQSLQFAKWRLHLFLWSSRGIAILVLSWAGFSKLYLEQSNFGAQPLSDYTALLAWGFGAEITRESITKLLQSFSGNLNSDSNADDKDSASPAEA